jgi:acyl-CoA synthetase (AMP-forming)/AMP-acid ligase II
VFHISPRNSSAALAHLLKNRSAVHLLTSSEVGLQSVARAALASIDPDESRWNDYISEMPDFESLFVETDDGFEMLPARSFHPDDVIAYIHSSGLSSTPVVASHSLTSDAGTTAFPKPGEQLSYAP